MQQVACTKEKQTERNREESPEKPESGHLKEEVEDEVATGEEGEKGWEKVTRGRKNRVSSAGKERTNFVQDQLSSCTHAVPQSNTLLQHEPEIKPTIDSSETALDKRDSPLPEADCSIGPPKNPACIDQVSPVPAVVNTENDSHSSSQVENDVIANPMITQEKVCAPSLWYWLGSIHFCEQSVPLALTSCAHHMRSNRVNFPWVISLVHSMYEDQW